MKAFQLKADVLTLVDNPEQYFDKGLSGEELKKACTSVVFKKDALFIESKFFKDKAGKFLIYPLSFRAPGKPSVSLLGLIKFTDIYHLASEWQHKLRMWDILLKNKEFNNIELPDIGETAEQAYLREALYKSVYEYETSIAALTEKLNNLFEFKAAIFHDRL